MTTKQKEKEIVEYFFSLIGYFNHYPYFTEELYRKRVKKYKNTDEAEIKAAIMSKYVKEKFDYNVMPCGMTWGTFFEDESDSVKRYHEEWKPLYNDFIKWQVEQR